MYLDIVPNRNSPPAILLRESYREGHKVRKRTLANLSHLDRTRVEALRRALRGEFDRLASGEPVCGRVFGLLYALKQIADHLGISRALGKRWMGKLALFLTLARVAHRGSRLSAVRWAKDHALREVLGLEDFDEDDLYAALDDLAERQVGIERQLYKDYVRRRREAPVLFLYDLTSSYLEGEKNELADFGYNRDNKRGKMQMVVGLLTDGEGEPLAVRVFAGNTADPSTVGDQIEILKKHFGVHEVVFVGDGGLVKSSGKQALNGEGLRYITALTNPQIRKLLKAGTLQMGLFEERICEVEADGLRYILRKNEAEARKIHHRLEDKLGKLRSQVTARNEKVAQSSRCQPEAGLRQMQEWVKRHKLSSFVSLRLEERMLQVEIDEVAQEHATLLAGCYVIETDVAKELLDAQTAHDCYKDLAHLEQDWRTMKTGLLEIRPVFVRKESRTRGHVLVCMLALKISREIQKRLTAVFGTTETDRYALTLDDAFCALNRLCLLNYPVPGQANLYIPVVPGADEHQCRILEALNVHFPKQLKM
ncbi:MAG: IS1634 family transposase [Acidobacteriota bacterium]